VWKQLETVDLADGMQRDEEAAEAPERRSATLRKRFAFLWARWRHLCQGLSRSLLQPSRHWDLCTCRDALVVLLASSLLLALWFYCLVVLSYQVLTAGCGCCGLVLALLERLQLCASGAINKGDREIFDPKCTRNFERWSAMVHAEETRQAGSVARLEHSIRGIPAETP